MDGMCSRGGPVAEGIVEHGCVTVLAWMAYELETGIQTVNRQPLQKRFKSGKRRGMLKS